MKQSSLGPHVVEECKPLVELTPGTRSNSSETTILNSNTDLNCHPSHNVNPFLSPVESPSTESLTLESNQQMSTFNHSSDHQMYHSSSNNGSYNYSIGSKGSINDQSQSDMSHFGIPLHHGTPHNMNPPTVPATSTPATNVTTSSSSSTSSAYHGPSVMAHVTF